MTDTEGLETSTDDEMLHVTNAFIATSNALVDAILALKRVEAAKPDHDELVGVVLQRRRLEDD